MEKKRSCSYSERKVDTISLKSFSCMEASYTWRGREGEGRGERGGEGREGRGRGREGEGRGERGGEGREGRGERGGERGRGRGEMKNTLSHHPQN